MSAGLRGLNKWQADSATEAALFVAAAIRKAEDELSRFLLSKTLFVDSPEGARQVPPSGGFNLISFGNASPWGGTFADKSGRTGSWRRDLTSDAESLDQISTQDFAAGLRAMGVEENEAFRLAGICCRSVVVFSRLDALGAVTARMEQQRGAGSSHPVRGVG